MMLSITAKEAFKTALAMTIAYAIALAMNWDKPEWAGFAVSFVSLSTSGQSFNKAAMRMLGTLVAAAVALILIALFAQDRWLFIFFLSIYIGFCTYMMGARKYQYFWNVCGFVCIIIALEAGPESLHAFETAIQRSEETGLGVLVYSVVASLLWRSNSAVDFYAIVKQLSLTQHLLYRAYQKQMNGQGDLAEIQTLKVQKQQQQARFQQLLDAAETDSYEIKALHREWLLYQSQVLELSVGMECWYDNFAKLQTLGQQRFLLNLNAFDQELEQRFVQINCMLEDTPPEHKPDLIDLQLDKDVLSSLSPFQKSILAATRSSLLQIEKTTRTLFETVSNIKDFSQVEISLNESRVPFIGFTLDIERLTSVVQLMATLWLAFLTYIFINDIPGGVGFIIMAGVVGMGLATHPQLPISKLFVPAAVSIFFSGFLYVVIMPQLTSFSGLGLMIFITTFGICYLFSKPQQMLGRTFGLAMFVSIASITNEQSYSFLAVADTALMFVLVFLLLAITVNIPLSPRSELAFLRLLTRYFHSSQYLMSTMNREQGKPSTYLGRWRKAFHMREIETLPGKLETWNRFINTQRLLGTTPEKTQALMGNLQQFTLRMQILLEARNTPQAQVLMQELLEDVRNWHLFMQQTLQSLSRNPSIGNNAALHTRLTEFMEQLEMRIRTVLDKLSDTQISDTESENFYRLLGSYQGVSEALLEYTGNADAIDWGEWREARF
ncbi:MAG: hypothetical protein GQ583_01575 [Methyloprofundus sp.]|nr:hypothetical protein [Methyloprofundus sp.]